MNTDSYCEIGHSHTICEDYALAGKMEGDIALAIVCDGCSASSQVDVGARVIAHSTQKFFRSIGKSFKYMDTTNMFIPIINNAKGVVDILGIDRTCLDSTLLAAIVGENTVKFYVFGDGFIIVKKKDGTTEFAQAEYLSGAPYYCSYYLSEDRRKNYKAEFGTKAKITFYNLQDGIAQFSDSIDLEDFECIYSKISSLLETRWKAEEIETITLSSDGMASYEKAANEFCPIEKIPLGLAITSASNYKGFVGQFVERRMKRMRKDFEKDSITHFDDISVASIHLSENET